MYPTWTPPELLRRVRAGGMHPFLSSGQFLGAGLEAGAEQLSAGDARTLGLLH